MNHVQVEELVEKYEVLVSLRRMRDEAVLRGLKSFPPSERPARRRAMRALAARFPGSLRELDDSGIDGLQARLAQLRSTQQGERFLPWMKACALFHEQVREVLAARANGSARRPETGRLLDDVWMAVGENLGLTAGEAERLVFPNASPCSVRR